MATDTEDPASSDAEHNTADDSMNDARDHAHKTESNASSDAQNGAVKPKSNDPSRPRRKKARRACFACQRAHLTCGDERPCQRCIKRGLQDQCQDGVRKKAKYLHDAPAEALIPPAPSGGYSLNGNENGIATSNTTPQAASNVQAATSAPRQSMYYAEQQPMAVDMFPQVPNAQQSRHQSQASASTSFGPHSATSFSGPSQHTAPMQTHIAPAQQNQNMQLPFDPSDPGLFNFDLSSLNFGNHFGALEFGMLEHMASTANNGHRMGEFLPYMNQQQYPNAGLMEQQPQQPHSQQSQQRSQGQQQADQHQRQPSLLFGQDAMMNVDWKQKHPPPPSNPALETPHNTPIIPTADRTDASGPPAYAIGARPNSLASASPISIAQDVPYHDLNSPSFHTHQQPASGYGRSHNATHAQSKSHNPKGGDMILQSTS